MKILPIALLLLIVSGAAAPAQEPAVPDAGITPTAPVPLRSDAELEQLFGPIALYPDALIALILPACAVPADIVLAAREVRSGDLSQVEARAWDDSVKSLTHYPDVLKWLDENLEWTKEAGEAFVAQPAEVMNAIQRLRARARDAGTLTTTPQQQIITSANVIRIIPAQPDVIYVPRYDPAVVFIDRPVFHAFPPLGFGFAYPVGSWLAYDCDWVQRKIWIGDRCRPWHGHDWHQPLVSPRHRHGSVTIRHWNPPPRPARPNFRDRDFDRRGSTVHVRPSNRRSITRPAAPALPHAFPPRTARTSHRHTSRARHATHHAAHDASDTSDAVGSRDYAKPA